MRSRWKFAYSNINIDRALLLQRKKRSRMPLRIYDRGSTILKPFVGQKVLVHQGQKFVRYTIKDFMVGHKFGEYALTKPMGEIIHVQKKDKKKQAKKK
jgi:small subunit ribosomal protein S19